jgi:N-acetylglucosamine kinase-like BadF-type ATPase
MIIGIDVGGTKTLIRAVDADGAERDLLVSTAHWLQGSSLEHATSIDRLFQTIATIAPGFDGAGGAAGSDVEGPREDGAALVIGAHGCDTPDQVAAFRDALAARHAGPLHVTNDAALVPPAAGVNRAVGVIAGTGSIVIGTDADGGQIQAGGHGWMIADPGSAPGIVREAMRAVIARADSGAAPELLGRTLMRHYGADDLNELAWVFMEQASIHRWAEAAPAVFDAADAGSTQAAATIERAGRELAEQVASVLRRGAVADAIVAAGGVVTNQPRLALALEHGLGDLGVAQPLRVLDVAPVAGAVAIGRHLLAAREVPEASARI